MEGYFFMIYLQGDKICGLSGFSSDNWGLWNLFWWYSLGKKDVKMEKREGRVGGVGVNFCVARSFANR
jgi:hypothetical protein